jgi:hypothetical protein
VIQQIYTPTDLLAPTELQDRPYAGFLGFIGGYNWNNNKRMWSIEGLIGWTGPNSGAEFVQSGFHSSAAKDSRIPNWENQLPTGYHFNLYLNYAREWKLEPNPFSVYFALQPNVASGTKEIYIENKVAFYFGNRNTMKHSAAYQQFSTQKELFFSIKLAYRYFFNDAILNGIENRITSTRVISPYNQRFLYDFEIFYRKKRNTFKVSYSYTSPEARELTDHFYTTVSFSRLF